MPTIITATELRTVLGVSSALYSDAILNDIIDTSETVILPLLIKYESSVNYHQRISNVATLYTLQKHNFVVGSSVVIAINHIGFDGTKTVTEVPDEYSFSYASTGSDVEINAIIPSGTATLSGASTYVGNSAVEQAVTVVAVEVFQSRTAAGGQIEGVDFAPAPYRMGRSLYNRISGLLGSYVDVESIIG